MKVNTQLCEELHDVFMIGGPLATVLAATEHIIEHLKG